MPSQSVLIGYFVQCPPLFIPMKDRMIISLNILQFHLFIRMWRAGKFYNAACRLIQNIYDRCKLLSTDWETASNWSKQGVLYMITHHHHQSASIPSSLALPCCHWLELERTKAEAFSELKMTWSSVGENKNISKLKPASAVRAAALPMIILTGFFLLFRSSVLAGPQMIDARSEIKIWISISKTGCPLCLLNQRYWGITRRTGATNDKLVYSDGTHSCIMGPSSFSSVTKYQDIYYNYTYYTTTQRVQLCSGEASSRIWEFSAPIIFSWWSARELDGF